MPLLIANRQGHALRNPGPALKGWATFIVVTYSVLCALKALYDNARIADEVTEHAGFGFAVQHVGALMCVMVIGFFPLAFLGIVVFLITSLAWQPTRMVLRLFRVSETGDARWVTYAMYAAILLSAPTMRGSFDIAGFVMLVTVGVFAALWAKNYDNGSFVVDEDWASTSALVAVIVQTLVALPVRDLTGSIPLMSIAHDQLTIPDSGYYHMGIATLGASGCLAGWWLTRQVHRLKRAI